MKFVVLAVVAALAVGANSQGFKCPPKDGQYEDSRQCDKYYECTDGQAVAKLCPDGLVFDPLIRKRSKCDQPFNVECEDRTELQPPQPKGPCPRRNGFFAPEDPSICNKFFNCIESDYIEITCTNGLHFDEYSGTCVWPASAGRQGCKEVSNILKDGFECPKGSGSNRDANGNVVVHPRFAHQTDCQRFYVCLNGVEPRDLGCIVGEVYNEETQRCDAPENVPGCEDWYKDDPAAPSAKPSKKN